MPCGCGKPKCNGKCGISPAVLQINNNECTLFHKVDVPASLGDSDTNPPKPGAYRNVLLYYEADENAFLYTSDGIPVRITGVSTDYNLLKNKPSINGVVLIENKTLEELGIIDAIDSAVAAEATIREEEDGKLSKAIDDEEADRIAADNALWDEIETIEASSDVVDVVGSYAELEAYDTSKLHDNDLIKVLQDETRDDAITYYRWSTTTETFSYVGEEGPYYTQSETDTLLDAKQDKLIAGTNIQIAADGKTISATDTTYTAGSGLDLTGTEFSVDTTTIQEKLTAGTNVQISNQNVISATDTTYTAGTGLDLTGTEFSVDTTVIAEKSDLPTKTSDLTNDGSDGTDAYAEMGDLPTKTSDLSNDGDDGTSPYATEDYVNTYGGKIDKIEVNGVEQTIVNKTVDITVPTKTSELTNDSNFPVDANYVHTDNNFTTALKNKLDGIESGAEVNVQSDWSQTTTTADDYIKNKPTKTSDFTNDGSDGTSVYVEADELAAVATTGSYTDLSNKPTIGDATLTIQKNSTTIDTFTANATSNKTIDISVPVETSDLNNDGDGNSPYATQDYVDTYGGKIDKIEVNGVEQTITNKTVDIAVPTKTSDITNDGSDGTSTYVENDDLTTTLSGYQEKLIAGSNIQIAADGKTISATDTTYSTMTGATSQDAGTSGLVPAPAAGDDTKYLSGDGLWKTISQYQLPIASDSTLGGVKVGSNLSIDSSTGVLSANVNNATLTIQKNGTSAGTFTANATSNKTINITVPTTAADVSALPDSTKYATSISMSVDTTDYKITTTLKDQDGNTLGTAQVIDLPLESVVVSGSYDNVNKKIVLTLENGNTVDIPVGDLVAGLQSEITSSNKLASDLVDDTNQANKFMTSAEKTKLSGIAAGAEVNVQSDWDQTNNAADDFIKNKPTIPNPADYYWANVKVSDTSKTNTTPTFAKGTFNTTSYPQVAGANSILTFSATGGWDSSSGPIVLNTTSFRPSSSATNVLDLGASNAKWKNLYMDGNIYKGSYTLTLPSKTGTVALTSDIGNATLTIQKNGTTVDTFTANATSNKTVNITVPTDTNDLTNGAGYITSSGTAAKANQLATARTIALGTGATGTATSFDGSSNITIPVTDVKDAYVTWGGKAIYNNISPDDAGCIDEFGHNKMAFLPANCIQVHYSTDGGSTWTDYGLTDAQKIQLVTYGDVNCKSGKDTTATSSNVTNLKLRVRIATAASTATGASSLYTMWKKILININDPGSDATMTFRYRTIANYKAGTETWVDSGATYAVRGGSGWNSIPIPTSWPDRFGGHYTNQTGQPGQIEFIFSNTKLGTWGDKKISASSFRMIGTTNWSMPSEMARAGHLYTVDSVQNATFPKEIALTDLHALNVLPKSGDTTYRHLGRSGEEWKDVWLTDAIYANGNKLSLPTTAGTLALTSDMPTVNNATLTIQKNGTNVQTFTANQSTNATANITVPTKTSELSNDSNFVASGDLATVATSGSYNDLSNKPTIPTVNNATLTIQKNGTTVNTFTANASSNVTANITVPTKVSDLTNTSGGFVTYCTCTSAANATTKTITVDSGDSNWTLRKGTVIGVRYTNSNTASNVKLDVGGSGAKSVYYNTGVNTGTSTIVFGYANRTIFYMYDGTYWVWISMSMSDGNDNTIPTAISWTAAGTAAKTASMSNYTATANRYVVINFQYANTSASAITLNINGTGAKPLYINGAASSSSNYSFAAGPYILWYNGTNYYLDTSGNIPRTVHPVDVAAVTDPTATVTNSMVADGTLTFAKTATGEFLKLQLSTVDIGEGASLAPNTLYGVYE